MIKTTYQTPEIRNANDEIVQEGAFGKNTALSNSTNDGWIDYVVNNLEALHDTIGDSAAHLDGNGHVVEPANLAIGDEDGNRLKTSYLKLSGGTMTGALNARLNLKMQDSQENVIGGLIVPDSSASDQYMRMYGGSAHDAGGAQLTLKQEGDGRFYLTAKSTDGSQTYDLRGDNNGSLYWRGWNVITSAGGTLNGQLVINRANSNTGGGIKLTGAGQNYAISALNTNVTKGSAPSATQYWGIDFYGKDAGSYNKRIGMLETTLNANNVATTAIRAYNCTTNTNTANGSIAVSVDGDGNAYTYAPTPTAGDNSTKIATTAFVRQNALPLSGGTMTGSIVRRGDFVFCNADDSFVRFSGSSEYTHGASLQLNGQDSTSNGRFALMARKSGVGAPALVGDPDGTLTWGGTRLAYETSAVRNVSSLASTSGSNTATFEMRGNSALVAVKRGANAQLFMCDYWTANSVTLSSVGSAIATVTKTANSNTVTITNTSSSAISVQIVSGANLL